MCPLAGDYISEEIEAYLDSYEGSYPVISSACPAVLRLIQTKYPELICHVVPALAPAEAAAIYVRRETMKRLNLVPEDVGIWFLFSLSREGHEYPSVGGCSPYGRNRLFYTGIPLWTSFRCHQ